MEIEFNVQNVKCNGCTSAIQNGLATQPGVEGVTATLDGRVTVTGPDLDRDALARKLAELGYPEA